MLRSKISIVLSSIFAASAMAGTMGDLHQEINQWTQFYVGMNTGWGWSKFSATENPFGAAAIQDISPQSVKRNTNGPFLGGQIGYNRQINQIVLGVEADVSGTGIHNNAYTASTSLNSLSDPTFVLQPGISTNAFIVNQTTDMLGSVRGRMGTEINFLDQQSLLAYFTAGYAWRQLTNQINATGHVALYDWSTSSAYKNTHTQSGYALGLGGEWKVASHWSVRSEYLFYGFNTTQTNNVYFANSSPTGSGVTAAITSNNINTVRLGVNYLA